MTRKQFVILLANNMTRINNIVKYLDLSFGTGSDSFHNNNLSNCENKFTCKC
jgi:hypothetical protein